MPYKCLHCSEVYSDNSKEILTGCKNCGSKFFFYIKEEKLKQILENKNNEFDLTKKEKDKIEQDVREIAGIKEGDNQPIFLDFESIRILKPGKYLLDLTKLLSSTKPRIYHLEDGKYIIDLFSPLKKKDNS